MAHKLADVTQLAGAALRGGQGRFNAVSVFSPFVPIFSVIPSREGKSAMSRKKNGNEPGKNSDTGAAPLGWGGQGGQGSNGWLGRDGAQGWGRLGQEGGRACS